MGITIFCLVTSLIPFLDDKYTISCLVLIFGDGLAPLSKYLFKKIHILKYTKNKSFEGLLICFISSFISIIIF